jgi:signal transduction histidine kinase
VTLEVSPRSVVLRVEDYGRGIPEELLTDFQTRGMSSGVGLTGMRERVRELGGHLDIQSTFAGTLIAVTLPLRNGKRDAVGEFSAQNER